MGLISRVSSRTYRNIKALSFTNSPEWCSRNSSKSAELFTSQAMASPPSLTSSTRTIFWSTAQPQQSTKHQPEQHPVDQIQGRVPLRRPHQERHQSLEGGCHRCQMGRDQL